MPLGKLSKKQVKAGYQVLSKLLQSLEKGDANKHKIIDATNRYIHHLDIGIPLLKIVLAQSVSRDLLYVACIQQLPATVLKSSLNLVDGRQISGHHC